MVEDAPVRGNESVWARLEADMPGLALLDGPAGVGKFYGASHLALKHAPPENVVCYQNLTMADARAFGEWLSWRSSERKIAVLEPGDCHLSVWTVLKCILEERPLLHHVWLVCSHEHPAPQSVRGMAFRYDFTLLSPGEMAQCFEDVGTYAQDEQYLQSLGSVDTALSMNRALNVKPAVSSWIEAVEQSNRGLLLTATKTWEQRHTDLLVAEIEKQLGKKTIVDGTRFSRVDRERLIRSLTLLRDCPDPYVGAVTVGLSLMPGVR